MEDLQLDDHEVCNDVHHEHDDHHEGSEKKITGTQNKILEGKLFHVKLLMKYMPSVLWLGDTKGNQPVKTENFCFKILCNGS